MIAFEENHRRNADILSRRSERFIARESGRFHFNCKFGLAVCSGKNCIVSRYFAILPQPVARIAIQLLDEAIIPTDECQWLVFATLNERQDFESFGRLAVRISETKRCVGAGGDANRDAAEIEGSRLKDELL